MMNGAPLTNDASREARKRMPAAISSGLPTRPTMRSSSGKPASSSVWPSEAGCCRDMGASTPPTTRQLYKRAAAGRPQVRDGLVADEVDALEVCVDDAVPFILGGLVDPAEEE